MNDDKPALAVVHEASQLYQHKLLSPAASSDPARAALLEGRLLLDQGRHHEAVTLLARGWQLAGGAAPDSNAQRRNASAQSRPPLQPA